MPPRESPDAGDGAARLRQHRREGVPDMRHARPYFQLGLAAGVAQSLVHAHRVVAQDLVAADLQEDRRQPGEIAIERRDVGQARVGAGEIFLRQHGEMLDVEHRIGARIELERRAGEREIGPRRQRDRGGRKRQAVIA